MRMWKRTFCLILLMLSGCGTGKIQLDWPATIHSFEGVPADTQSALASEIEELNTKLGKPVFTVGSGNGSPISIVKVSSFNTSTSSVLASELAYVEMGSMQIATKSGSGNTGSLIAGRATLSPGKCQIELASFLFDSAQNADLLIAVLWHELGHCGGLGHVSEPGELMSPLTLPLKRYTSEQIQRFVNDFSASIR